MKRERERAIGARRCRAGAKVKALRDEEDDSGVCIGVDAREIAEIGREREREGNFSSANVVSLLMNFSVR